MIEAEDAEVDGTAGCVKGAGDEGGRTVRRNEPSSPIS